VQTPTHLKTAVLINQLVPEIKPGYVRSLVVAFLGIYSHVLLDALSVLTYHPPNASPQDWFWRSYHAGLAALTLKVWTKNQQRHKWAMICAVLPDLDWFFIKIPKLTGNQTTALQRPILHELLFKTLYAVPLLGSLKRLPALRQKKSAVFLELVLYILLSRVKK
jgi:hypothetical protein